MIASRASARLAQDGLKKWSERRVRGQVTRWNTRSRARPGEFRRGTMWRLQRVGAYLATAYGR